VAGLVAVAALPVAAGLSGPGALDPGVFADGFTRAVLIAGLLCAGGGLLAFLTIRNPAKAPAPAPERALEPRDQGEPCYHCGVSGPPPRTRVPERAG
jgi:hypothetical protein